MDDEFCISCSKIVRPRQEALRCDDCGLWQHRTCDTGVTRELYRCAVREEMNIDWQCLVCELSVPVGESTRNNSPSNSPRVADVTIQPSSPRYTLSDASLQPSSPADASFHVPPVIEESSLQDESPQQWPSADEPDAQFTVVRGGTLLGKDLLTDTNGFTYTVKTTRPNGNRLWTCSVRSKALWCKATVSQKSNIFTAGSQRHIHEGKLGATIATTIAAEIKRTAAKEIFTSAAEVVNKVMLQHGLQHNHQPLEAMRKPTDLARAANRHRQKDRPEEPRDLQFVISEEHIPQGFLRGDVTVDGKRHLLFATDQMITLLGRSKKWYLDGTFKVVKEPFKQLLSFHSFVRSGDDMKQVPLMFVLMSSRKKKDYKKVIKKVKQITAPQHLKEIVIDFERAMWKAIPTALPSVSIRGCAFHWSQCIWRKIQEIGLAPAYRNDSGTHKLCRQLLALPYLPHEHIVSAFEKLEQKAQTNSLQELMDYVRRQWIDGDLWVPRTWSVFRQVIRTNNDVEGWHGALNRHAQRSNISFYLLVTLLHQQADLVSLQVRLVSEHKLHRRQRRQYRQLQAKVYIIWDKYIEGDLSAKQLLKKCSLLVPHNA